MFTLNKFVLGFCFNGTEPSTSTRVVLIRKNRPTWQSGLLNGVGGKIDILKNEGPIDAMCREFEEETGVNTDYSDWIEFCILSSPSFICYCFKCFNPDFFEKAETKEDEMIEKILIDNIKTDKTIHNIPLLLSAALSESNFYSMELKYSS